MEIAPPRPKMRGCRKSIAGNCPKTRGCRRELSQNAGLSKGFQGLPLRQPCILGHGGAETVQKSTFFENPAFWNTGTTSGATPSRSGYHHRQWRQARRLVLVFDRPSSWARCDGVDAPSDPRIGQRARQIPLDAALAMTIASLPIRFGYTRGSRRNVLRQTHGAQNRDDGRHAERTRPRRGEICGIGVDAAIEAWQEESTGNGGEDGL